MKKSIIVLFSIFALFLVNCGKHHRDHKQHKDHTTLSKQHRFNEIKKWVRIFEDPERAKWQQPKKVVEAMNILPGNTIADIGAGTGYVTRLFATATGPTGKALGLDIEPAMVNYMVEDAKKRDLSNYLPKLIKMDDASLKPRSVDIIFLCNTYHHIEAREDYFKIISRSLKDSGRVIIVDFYKKETPIGPPLKHKLAKETVMSEMENAGYHLVKSHDFLLHQYFLEFSQ